MNFRLIGTVLLLASFSFAAYSGTPKTPSKVDGCYQIGSAEELYGFAEMVNDGDETAAESCIKLTADIVVNENVLTGDKLNKSDSLTLWIPINVFYGIFDGQGHTISGLYKPDRINGYDAGLFKILTTRTDEDSVVVKNLTIVDSYFGGQYVGAITAKGYNNLHIENCSVLAIIEGSAAGGFAGLVTGKLTIKDSFHSGRIYGLSSAASYTAGLISLYHSGEAFIINSYHIGSVDRAPWSGGLFGLIGGDHAEHTIVHIENSFCIGSETIAEEAGPKNEVYITNSFYQSNKSSESAKTEAEFNDGTVALALHYGNDGKVWGQKIGVDPYPTHSGSITGNSNSTKISKVNFHTYDGDTAVYRSEYVEGVSTTLPSSSRKDHILEGWYTNPQFTGNAVTAISSTDKGDLDFYAHWLVKPTYKDGCYELADENDLRVFVAIVNGMFNMDQDMYACGKLTADIIWNEKINKDAKPWIPMNLFKGTLDGQGHKISGIYINSNHSSSYTRYAFILSIMGDSEESPVTIKNIGLENFYNEANAKTGGIAGNIIGYAYFESIYLIGRILPRDYAEGCSFIASNIRAKLSITNSYFVSTQEERESFGPSPFIEVSRSSEISITNSFFYSPYRGSSIPNSINGNQVTYGTFNLTNFYISDSLYLDTAKFPVIKADSAQFANGTIAKALHDYNENGLDGSIWGQTIGKDLYPVHTGKIDTVKIASSSSSKTTSSSSSPKASSSASTSSSAKSSSSGKSSSSKAKSSSSKKTSILSAIPVQETAKIYSQGRNIFVEQYNGLVTVFDLNGNLVRDAYSNGHTEIHLKRAGTYIVRIGAKSRRISLTTDH